MNSKRKKETAETMFDVLLEAICAVLEGAFKFLK